MSKFPPLTELALLLCARWATGEGKPLNSKEFAGLYRLLVNEPELLEQFLNGDVGVVPHGLAPERLSDLLQRGTGVMLSLDNWLGAGLWVASWKDDLYPKRFTKMKTTAPPLVFGIGDANRSDRRALGIVGSRKASAKILSFAGEVGAACARNGVVVVSGGAKGVDSAGMEGGLSAGGSVVGVLSNSLRATSCQKVYRTGIGAGTLTLLSEVHPDASFNIGLAMARNKLIYASADAVLVLESDADKGGTWEGAVEALKGGNRVFVLRGAKAEKRLVQLGAISVTEDEALNVASLLDPARWLSAIVDEPNLFASEGPPLEEAGVSPVLAFMQTLAPHGTTHADLTCSIANNAESIAALMLNVDLPIADGSVSTGAVHESVRAFTANPKPNSKAKPKSRRVKKTQLQEKALAPESSTNDLHSGALVGDVEEPEMVLTSQCYPEQPSLL